MMDVEIKETRDGKNYNRFGQEIIPCGLCGKPTTMLGTKRCDACWELETRVQADPGLARRILAAMPNTPTNYGTNSTRAYTDLCPTTGYRHRWESIKVGRCLYDCTCKDCDATTTNDSSD